METLIIILLFLLAPFLASASALSFSTKLIRLRDHNYSYSVSHAPNSKIIATVLPSGADHLMQFSIGTPPVKVLAVIDTGSDLIWSRCTPCIDCKGRNVPAFNPALSSTYKGLPCNSTPCSSLGSTDCPNNSTCRYTYGYADGSYTTGVLALETLTFDSVDGNPVSVPKISFGCGHNNSDSIDSSQIGIVGFGGQPSSLISQLGPSIGWKFSYCLVPFEEKSSSSIMNFGDKAVATSRNAVSMPLVDGDDKAYYCVTLESITIGSTKIDASSMGVGNILIDSGTTVTLLNADVYNQVADAVANVVGLTRTTDAGKSFACYNATSMNGFPGATFSFDGGANVDLTPTNVFTPPSQEGLVCLAMQATEGKMVLGNVAQHNFHVGFDLAEKKVSFAPTLCSKMSG